MLESITFRCRPGAQFHFGKIALDENTSLDDTTHILHSDTLASAFVDLAFRVLRENAATQVLTDFENGTVRVSSLFWQLDLPNGHVVHFLPKPVSFDAAQDRDTQATNAKETETDRKDILRARFISKGVWEAGIQPKDWAEKCVVLQREFVLTREEAKEIEAVSKKLKLYHNTSLPKVAVHKLTRENSLYHQTNVQIANPADYGLSDASVHFYFLLESGDTAARNRVWNLAQIMADEGIGGERSVGCGRLDSAEAPKPFQLAPAQQTKKLFCSASLVSPAGQAEFEHFMAWKIITRGGRPTTNDGPLKRLKMLAEGAILETKVTGSTHDISAKKDRRYLRFGMALCLPAHDHHQFNPTAAS
jgi:CRISPR-associated protein Csm4